MERSDLAIPLEHSIFTIPQLDSTRRALDLSNALMAVSGISHIDVDTSKHLLTVEYDLQYLSLGTLREFVKGAGYPPAGDERSP